MPGIQHSLVDRCIMQLDQAARTLIGSAPPHARRSPAADIGLETDTDNDLSRQEKRHAAGLMRINHSGEVCAQALYQGQALTARLTEVRATMAQAAEEEMDHLAWCEERVEQLGSHTSLLNPVFYALSFGIGAGAGLIGDKYSLGFVAATEQQVCKHLQNHLEVLPSNDSKSRAVVAQMLEDEAQHADQALDAGGVAFPSPVKAAMSLVSKVMTKATYRL